MSLAALTIRQPFAWAIAIGAKPVENRDWPPPAWLFGRSLAIHAGRQYDELGAQELAANLQALGLPAAPPPPAQLVQGAIVAVVTVVGAIETEASYTEDDLGVRVLRRKKVLGDVSLQQADELVASPWASGPWLWVLRQVVRIDPPVPCRGLQRIWHVHRDQLPDVRERYRAAVATKEAAHG